MDIQCVNYGLPRPEIVFFRGALQITPGQGMFSNFARVTNKFDTIRLTWAQRVDGGQYVCEARNRSRQLNRSLPVDLEFCSKCQVGYPHQLINVYPRTQTMFLFSHMAYSMCRLLSPHSCWLNVYLFLLHSSSHHSEPTSTRH